MTHSAEERLDRIPIWDNNPDTFNEFEDRCLWYERGLSARGKPQAVARIVAKLTSTAWKIIKDLNAKDQRRLCACGVQDLTTFLRSQLLEMGIPEVGKRFGESRKIPPQGRSDHADLHPEPQASPDPC